MITSLGVTPAGCSPSIKPLGLTVGVLQMADRTENGKKAFLVDLDKPNAREDLHQLVFGGQG